MATRRSALAKKKTNARASKARKVAKPKAKKVQLLSGGNPRIARAEGDKPVRASIAAMPSWKSEIAACRACAKP